MNKKNSRRASKGFTLAELLVVIAIIGVLVAISIPVFTAQLTKARQATNQANARAAKAVAVIEYMNLTATPAEDHVMVYSIDTGQKRAEGITGLTKCADPASVTAANATDQTKYPGDTTYKFVIVTLDKTNGALKTYEFANPTP